ncbi:MAG: hypothetical protein UY62_C0014G0014 [Parcubacteria group bacterium GW2011_GWF2_50_9]|nr:MAG: hypothetical protein UY62_C0014G0014 [Parcubacteria group bacterium GW2011_GWF2_50_9]
MAVNFVTLPLGIKPYGRLIEPVLLEAGLQTEFASLAQPSAKDTGHSCNEVKAISSS